MGECICPTVKGDMRWNGGRGEVWQLDKMGGADSGGSKLVEELPI